MANLVIEIARKKPGGATEPDGDEGDAPDASEGYDEVLDSATDTLMSTKDKAEFRMALEDFVRACMEKGE